MISNKSRSAGGSKRKIFIIIAAAVLALLAGLPLFFKLYYGRSQAATLFAWQFRKDRYTTQERFEEYLQEQQAENARLYIPPPPSAFTVPLRCDYCGDMTYYILNEADAPEQLIVYFAGGSYIDQPREVHWQFLNSLAEDTGAAVMVPIYPKLPDFAAADAYAALADFCGSVLQSAVYDELIFMGDSAGGGMAISLAMQLRDSGGPVPDRIIAMSPWVDVTMANPEIPAYEKKDPALDSELLRRLGRLWAGEIAATDPVVSPLYGDLSGLGDITVFVGTGELLYPDIMLFDQALTRCGANHATVVSKGMFHVWPLYKNYGIPEAQETYGQIVDILTGE